MKTITLTPTWTDLLPILLTVLIEGAAEGKREVRAELARMAKAADLWNAANAKDGE